MLGPIDYIVVGFEGNNFDGSILEELSKAVENGAIRLVDLLFVLKDEEGNVLAAEVDDQHAELIEVANTLGLSKDTPLLTEDDMTKVAEGMENNTSAGILVIEHLWALGLKEALQKAGAVLLDEGRIHSDTVTAALEEIKEMQGE